MPPLAPGPTRIVRLAPPRRFTTFTTTRPPDWYETAHWGPSASVTVGFSPGPTTELRPLRRTLTLPLSTQVIALPSREKFGWRPRPTRWTRPPCAGATRIRLLATNATLRQCPSIDGSLAAP